MKAICDRKVDNLGRIIIPIEARTELGIETNSEVTVYINDSGNVELSLKNPYCISCKSTDDLLSFKGKHICLNCKNMISEIK